MAPWDTEVHSASGWIVHIGKVPMEEVGSAGLPAGCSQLSPKVSLMQKSPFLLKKTSSIRSRELSVFITAGSSGVCDFDNWAQRLYQLGGASRKLDSRTRGETLAQARSLPDSCLGDPALATHGISPVCGFLPNSLQYFRLKFSCTYSLFTQG